MRSFSLFFVFVQLIEYQRYNKDFNNFQEVQTRLLRTRNGKKVRSFLWRISFYPCFSIIIYFALLVAQICIHLFCLLFFVYCFEFGTVADLQKKPPAWTHFLAQMVFLEGFLCAVAYGFTPALRLQHLINFTVSFFKKSVTLADM